MNRLVELLDYGQSYWLDNLTRQKIDSGELKKRVTEQGLRGITSNPSIFLKAFTEGDEYDGAIRKLAKAGKSAEEVYETLTVRDVRDACDVLRPVFDESKGLDGFVSLEVSPYLARDTEGTMAEARRLYAAVDRPNCYIKIPGTREGVPAIEQMVYEGVNINVTLLFSIDRYAEVAEAYVQAVRRRLQEGKSVDRTVSVASFFLSRIDVLTDHLLKQYEIKGRKQDPDPRALRGKAAVASARLAYQKFKEVFGAPGWKELSAKGAHVQRVLWASTSNKDPDGDDVRYVNPLIGPDTVNTLPDETIDAFQDHGTLKKDAIEDDLGEAKKVFPALRKFDIDIAFVTQELEYDGVDKFTQAFDKLMKALGEKIAQYKK